ncbi:MAG TPA: PAS domain-containing sensor histidine kinase [Acidimicrobiales bacterium]|nr:PAS domain-containing sensor histidine kinase [Acidimicrobiales bacterium]
MIDADLLPDAIVQIDADRRIVAVNARAADLVGAAAESLLGRDVAEGLSARTTDGRPLLVDGWHPSARLASVRAVPEQEIRIVQPGGNILRANATGTYLRAADGALQGLILAIRPHARREQTATSGIEIVSTVSHELRAPLTSVKGYTSLLLKRWDRLPDDQKLFMLEQVHHDADRVTRLITELLDISRLETGRLVLRRQMVDVCEIARSVVDKVAMEYADLECAVVFPDQFPKVYADPDKVVQVLTNLVENACKYASPAGVRVEGTVAADEVEVAVSDRGEGIPADELPKVFAKFFRRAEGRPTGSGLGLWISRGLVEAHGGRLTAASVEGEGTTFCFTIPTNAFEEIHGE